MAKIIKRLQHQANLVGGGILPTKKSPDELLGELFRAVQLGRVHSDGKTFVDAVPTINRRRILRAYKRARKEPDFDLTEFVRTHFTEIVDAAGYQSHSGTPPDQHMHELWPVLTRHAHKNQGSLLALPHPYIVPGGRFQEQFYWDSYFIMLGLAVSDRYDLIDGIMKNAAYMLRKLGYIPTANRTYLLSRSQPPFFAHMVRLLAEKKGRRAYIYYLPYLLREYQFWMTGGILTTARKPAHKRVVRMPDGTLLNRYYDAKATPRPESYFEDVKTAELAGGDPRRVYRDLRAAAESGWDFTSRWMRDGNDLRTIHTTEIVPVDLNCLLYDLEITIASSYRILRQPLLEKLYLNKAEKRAKAIRTYCWNEDKKFFYDYDFVAKTQTNTESLAGAFPLYSKVATPEQAKDVAIRLRKDFLKPGGLVTTLHDTGQQWDAPNGWAPLQWTSIVGLRNYGLTKEANEIKQRWVAANLLVYDKSEKMVEKYNVVDQRGDGGGGEYLLQDGFGWTNGVLLQLLNEDKPHV
jgi:alpha,alpha-trehalase